MPSAKTSATPAAKGGRESTPLLRLTSGLAGQVTTLLIAQLGTLAISASAAVAAATQVASSGLSAAFTACASIRVGYHLGRGDVRASRLAMWIVVAASVASTVVIVGHADLRLKSHANRADERRSCDSSRVRAPRRRSVLWPLRWQLCALVTDDQAVMPVAAELVRRLPPLHRAQTTQETFSNS